MIMPRLHRRRAASALLALALAPLACTLSTAGIPGGVGGGGGAGPCASGDKRPCFGGAAEKAGKGICKAGEQICGSDGVWPADCPGQVLPLGAEQCDNALDDDCNGKTNDGCTCTPGEIASCYSGDPATRDIGACKSGSHVCDASGEGFGPCGGEILPLPENCASALDEDCDGKTPSCTGDPVFLVQHGNGPMFPDEDMAFAAAAGPDGSFIVAGVEKATLLGYEVSTGDLSLVKIGADGKVAWSQSLPTDAVALHHAVARAVAVDADGNVVVAGELAGHLDFAGMTLKSTGNSKDIFVARLDKDGKQLWAKIFGDGQAQTALGVALDGEGSIYMTGIASGKVDFKGGNLNGLASDVFVVKLDKDGAHQWSRGFGDVLPQVGWSIAVAPDGKVVVAGDLLSKLDLGGVMLTSAGGSDAFLAELDGKTGATLWGKRFGDDRDQTAYSVAVDAAGHIALTGVFRGFIDFGKGALGNADANELSRDLFVASFDEAGNALWSRRFGDNRDQEARAVTTDGAGNVVVAGSFLGTLSFGATALVDVDGNNLNNDFFVAKLAAGDGEPLWAKRFGDLNDQRGLGLATAINGNSLVTGGFKGTLFAGSAGTIVSLGDYDIFALALAP